jgi:Trk-type K+ transport system membrane component
MAVSAVSFPFVVVIVIIVVGIVGIVGVVGVGVVLIVVHGRLAQTTRISRAVRVGAVYEAVAIVVHTVGTVFQ